VSTSRIPACTDALISLLTAALPTSLQIVDGAVLQNEERAGMTIGANLDDSEYAWEQDWAGLGHVTRDEVFEIPCILWTRAGDNDVKTYRDEVFGYFATVENTLRSTENLGITGGLNVRADIRPTKYAQPKTAEGVVCRIDFVVRCQVRI
jgi:hypothetical protein